MRVSPEDLRIGWSLSSLPPCVRGPVITTDFSDGSSLTILLSLALTARKLSIFTIQTPLHLSTTRCLFAPDELHDNQLLRVLLMKHHMFAQMGKSATGTEKPKKDRWIYPAPGKAGGFREDASNDSAPVSRRFRSGRPRQVAVPPKRDLPATRSGQRRVRSHSESVPYSLRARSQRQRLTGCSRDGRGAIACRLFLPWRPLINPCLLNCANTQKS